MQSLPESLPLASAAYLTLDNLALKMDLLRTQGALLAAQLKVLQHEGEREREYLCEAPGVPRVAACRYAYDATVRALRLVPTPRPTCDVPTAAEKG